MSINTFFLLLLVIANYTNLFLNLKKDEDEMLTTSNVDFH